MASSFLSQLSWLQHNFSGQIYDVICYGKDKSLSRTRPITHDLNHPVVKFKNAH